MNVTAPRLLTVLTVRTTISETNSHPVKGRISPKPSLFPHTLPPNITIDAALMCFPGQKRNPAIQKHGAHLDIGCFVPDEPPPFPPPITCQSPPAAPGVPSSAPVQIF